jgi:thiamine-phosphate pyrophosphorylase
VSASFPLPPLYPILDEGAAILAGHSVPALAEAFLAGGARILQLRAKLAPSGRFVELAQTLAGLAQPAGALVVVNDRFDVALAAGIRSVHVGQDDVPVAMVRRFLGPEGIIGYSTHTREQVDAALYEPIDYLAVGPIFTTASKDPGYDPVGLDLVRYAASKTELPIVAIGGITMDRARSVIDAGARSVAVIGDLLSTGDPEARVRHFLQTLRAKP